MLNPDSIIRLTEYSHGSGCGCKITSKVLDKILQTNIAHDVEGQLLVGDSKFAWPLDKLAPEVGAQVVAGGRAACKEVGIPLAGGHSIDAPEPVFGLALSGKVKINELKRNNTAREGDLIFLTKPVGVGILTTAQDAIF